MTEDSLAILSAILFLAGLGWFVAVDMYRGRTQRDSHRLFWLNLSAPVVASVLMILALWLMIGSMRMKQQKREANDIAVTQPIRWRLFQNAIALKTDPRSPPLEGIGVSRAFASTRVFSPSSPRGVALHRLQLKNSAPAPV